MITGTIHSIAHRMTKALSQLGVPIPYEKVLAALQLSEFPVSPDQTPDPPGWRKSMEGKRPVRLLVNKAALRAAQDEE